MRANNHTKKLKCMPFSVWICFFGQLGKSLSGIQNWWKRYCKRLWYANTTVQRILSQNKKCPQFIIKAPPHRDGCKFQPFDIISDTEPFNFEPNHYYRPSKSLNPIRGADLIISGSDFHHRYQLATCLMCTKQPPTDTYMMVDILIIFWTSAAQLCCLTM